MSVPSPPSPRDSPSEPPSPVASPPSLEVIDSRTQRLYHVPIHSDNIIRAADIGAIIVPDAEREAKHQKQQGLRILDKGYEHTAVMESSITKVDGLQGTIHFRGHMIEDLFEKYEFEDVMHLIIFGGFPSEGEKEAAREKMSAAMVPPESVQNVVKAFPKDTDTAPFMQATLAAFAASDPSMMAARHAQKSPFVNNRNAVDEAVLKTIAYVATTVALVYCHKHGKEFGQPQPKGSLISNLLIMMGHSDEEVIKYEPTLKKLWILYADHEMSCSTAAVLHSASSLADPVSCCVSGLTTGFGPLHGGAIDLAFEGFQQIGRPQNVPFFLAALKQKKGRLFGYGHRIYKTRDPRINLIEKLIEMNKEAIYAHPLSAIAMAVDKAASQDEYLAARGVRANADLFGCLLYNAIGFEKEIITAVTIVSRTPGVMAHWREAMSQPVKLWRPQQVFTGEV